MIFIPIVILMTILISNWTIESKIESVFTSLSEMESLIDTEESLIKDLEVFINKEKENLDVIERYLNTSKTEYIKAIQDQSEYFANPINALTLLKRLSVELTNIEKFIKEKKGFKKNQLMKYPSLDALACAATGLIRLQTTYHLNITDLANGVLSYRSRQNNQLFEEYSTPMTASECYELGLVPMQQQGYTRKIAWMMEALKRRNAENCTFCFIQELAIVDHISNSYYHLGDFENTIKWIQYRMNLRPNSAETTRQVKFMKKLQKRLEKDKMVNKTQKDPNRKLSQHELPHSICHRKINVRREVRKMLRCGYIYGRHPFLHLARAKVEMLHYAPDVILFHDVVSDTEIRILQHIARPKMWRERIIGQDSIVETRHASAAFLNETVDYVHKITRRVSVLTGLNMMRSETLKIINYGIGGHYAAHHDFLTNGSAMQPEFLIKGDKIATVMIYMSEVEQGGATVFNKLGLKVYPVKGAALFWYNLYPSGDGNYFMQHEACPVLRGSKWIAMKWAREADQKYCPIWKSSKGIITGDMYLKSKIREPFRDQRFTKIKDKIR